MSPFVKYVLAASMVILLPPRSQNSMNRLERILPFRKHVLYAGFRCLIMNGTVVHFPLYSEFPSFTGKPPPSGGTIQKTWSSLCYSKKASRPPSSAFTVSGGLLSVMEASAMFCSRIMWAWGYGIFVKKIMSWSSLKLK